MILAFARPQWGTREINVRTEGINIILAVDLSESMAALDFQKGGKIVDRLEAAKGVIQDFITKRTGDRLGLVVFGSEAYTQLPLTRDYDTLSEILERLEIGAAGTSTAIGDAVGIALKRLEDIEGKSNIIILLTDGRSNSGTLSPEAAVEIAARKGVKIYTVGIGGEGTAPFRVTTSGFGPRYVYKQVNMDEDALKDIAKKTDGLYFKAENTQGLEKIYDTIDQLEKTEAVVKIYDNYRDLYPVALLPAFGLLAFWILLVHTRFLRVP
jgi:Ca-activated chloride channel family protein